MVQYRKENMIELELQGGNFTQESPMQKIYRT